MYCIALKIDVKKQQINLLFTGGSNHFVNKQPLNHHISNLADAGTIS
jgi:hypothetical protein